MKNKSFMIIVLTILLLQPVLAGFSMPSAMITTQDTRVVAQGYRVAPSELIDHVPIFINGTDDFVSQGWTGAGTSGNPYVISSLNITRDVSQICIDIMNTDAYFIIEDCFIKQDSQMVAIRFTNTSHGEIDYSTVYGQEVLSADGAAIYLLNANNTVVAHTESQGRYSMGYYAVNSNTIACTDSLFNSTVFRAFRVDTSDGLVISGCEFYSYAVAYWCTRFGDVNHTTISSSEFYASAGPSGISIQGSYYSSINDCYIWADGASAALSILACPDILVTNVTTEYGGSGFYVSGSPGFHLNEGSFSEATDFNVYVEASANSTISNIHSYNSNYIGFYMINSDNVTTSNCLIDTTGNQGMYIYGCDFAVFEDLWINYTNDDMFYAESSHNGSISSSNLEFTGGSGIYLYESENWTVTGNHVNYTDSYAIYAFDAMNVIISENSIYMCEDGISVDVSDDAMVLDNEIAESSSTAVGVGSCDRAIISGNIVTDSYNGMYFDSCVNLTVYGNMVEVDGWTGIYLSYLDTSVIEGNTINNSPYYGITISTCYQLEILDNTLNDCGFYFQPDSGGWGLPFVYSYFNHTFSGNTINGEDLYYARDVEGLVLDADDYAQFILLNVSDVVIQDGSFGSVTCPIEIFHSDEIVIDGVMIPANMQGIVLGTGENITITDSSITGIYSSGDYYGGIYSNNVDNLEVLNCGITRSEGLQIINSEVALVNNTEFTYCDLAIRGYNSNNITATYSSFLNLEGDAFYAFPGGQFTVFSNNVVMNVTTGIYLEEPDGIIENNLFWQIQYYGIELYDADTVIHNNEIYHAGIYGIYLGSSANFVNITENYIESCYVGIYSSSGDDLRIHNNTVLYSDIYAIDLYRSSNSEIYYNIFALSGTENARDRDSGAYNKNWDDGSVLGNWWDDYTPPGVYSIIGGASSVDNYPMAYLPTSPIVDHPLDFYYAEFSTGNEITWRPYDNFLRDWELYIDGDLWDSDAWNFVDVTVNIDGLAYGVYEAEIVIYDVDSNFVTDTVMIHVYDDRTPDISNVPNTWAFVAATGQTLEWEVSDKNPDTYSVTIDDEEYDTDTWSNGTIEVNIDGLSEGEHILVMTIFDVDHNSAADRVLIRVINDDTDPTIDTPDDIMYTVGDTGNSIVWNPEDEYPALFEVSYNGSVQISGSWGGARVVVNVDGLPVGTHVFTLSVEDASGNSVSDSVTVTVLAIEGVEPPQEPLDLGPLLIVLGIAGVAIIIVVALVFYRKRT